MKKLLSLISFILPLQLLPAQEPDTIALQEVTVVSSGIVLKRNETGRNIIVIPGTELTRQSGLSIDEILRYLPGIEAQSRGGFGTQSDFSIRGSTFSQVLVLIDGMRLNDPLTGHFSSYIPVTPSEIERIEIVSGPAASIYGPDAVGGVIHIITKTFSGRQDDSKTGFEGKLMGGQHALIHLQTGGMYHKNKLTTAGGIMWNASKGYPLPSRLNADFDLRSASVSAAWKINASTSISARTAYDLRDFNAQYFYSASTADSSREKVDDWWNQLRIQHEGRKHQQSLDAGWKMLHDKFSFNSLTPVNKHQTDLFQLRFIESWTITDNLKLQTGAQSGYRTIVSTDRGNHANGFAGLYVLGYFRPVPAISLTSSLRGDYDESYGFELLPQFSASLTRGALVIRASTGRSTRSADFTERYVSTHLPSVAPKRSLGNPYLKAESSWNSELGGDMQMKRWGTLSMTLFYRNATNLIDYVLTNEADIHNNENLTAGADYLYARNIRQLHTKGVETFYIGNIELGSSANLNLRLGYTWQLSDNNDSILSKYISNAAHHLVTADFSLQSGRLQFKLSGLWKQRNADFAAKLGYKQDASYFVCNASVNIALIRNKLFLIFQANNFFDKTYSDLLGARMPGRWLMAGIRWQLP